MENALEETATMDNGSVDVSHIVPSYSYTDAAIAIAGGDGLSTRHQNVITCEICQVSCCGIAPYKQHIVSSKHKKKAINESMKKTYGPRYLEALKNLEHESETSMEATESARGNEDAVVMTCDICKKICTGIVSYKLHMKGKSHQKELRKQNLIKKLREDPEFNLDENEEGSENSVYDDMSIVKPFAECDICSKTFSGPQALQDHLYSGAHKKKLIIKNLSEKLDEIGNSAKDELVNPGAGSLGGGDGSAHCHTCEKSFSGPIPYQQHLMSDVHKKKMKRLELTEKMKLLSVSDEKLGTFPCKDCERSFSIPEEFEQHLKSSSHTKRKAKQQMVKKLQDAYPEMEIQAATTDGDTDGAIILICNVCHRSFNGPESALAHFSGKTHAKAKRHLVLVQQGKLEQGLAKF